MAGGIRRKSSGRRGRVRVRRGSSASPTRRLHCSGCTQQGPLLEMAGDELHAYGQPLPARPEWHRYGRRAGQAERHRRDARVRLRYGLLIDIKLVRTVRVSCHRSGGAELG